MGCGVVELRVAFLRSIGFFNAFANLPTPGTQQPIRKLFFFFGEKTRFPGVRVFVLQIFF